MAAVCAAVVCLHGVGPEAARAEDRGRADHRDESRVTSHVPSHVISHAGEYDAELATAWFDLASELTRDTAGFSPPVASRAFGYLGVTLYEALVPGMPGQRSLVGQLTALPRLPSLRVPGLHWPTVANTALSHMARQLYAGSTAQALENSARIDALHRELQQKYRAPTLGKWLVSALWGYAVADAIDRWARQDGGHEGYLRNFPESYAPPVGPGLWTPTPPAHQRALQPYWGGNRVFVPATTDCKLDGPPAYSEARESEFYAEADEVVRTVAELDAERLAIARFWSDDPGLTSTPPGHSVSIATQVLRQKHSDLQAAAEVYARVGLAVADAFIACWRAKYEHNLLRPVSYARLVLGDPAWLPPLGTPPFPEYPSGHSVQSGATAETLTAVFGPIAFIDRTHEARGMAPRTFDSFYDAAHEAAVSRLYGGIHFRAAIDDGLAQGLCVGRAVNGLQFRAAEHPVSQLK